MILKQIPEKSQQKSYNIFMLGPSSSMEMSGRMTKRRAHKQKHRHTRRVEKQN